MADVITVREAVERSKADGIPVSEYTLRRWIKQGNIPHRKAGNKILVYYPNLVKYLQCEDGGDVIPGIVRGDMDRRNPRGGGTIRRLGV